MDVKGEVQRCGPFGKFLDVAVGRVDIDLVFEQIQTQGEHEFFGISLVALALENFPQPGKLFQVFGIDPSLFLIQPVGGHAMFGLPMHLFRTNLDFDAFALRPDDSGVQALVAVGLGHGDVVFEASVHRLPL